MILDFTALEYLCNLTCGYCRGYSGHSPDDRRVGELVSFSPQQWREYLKHPLLAAYLSDRPALPVRHLPINLLAQAAVETILRIAAEIPLNVLKLSGGEITLCLEIIEKVLRSISAQLRCKILSNGVLLQTADVKRWLNLHNALIIQVSLDGIEGWSNSYRFDSDTLISRLLEELKQTSALGTPIEINSVLTSRSIENYFSLVDWAASHLPAAQLFPRPVRNISDDRFSPTPSQVAGFEKQLWEEYDRYSRLFPSRHYCELLVQLLKKSPLTRNCTVPRRVIAASLSGQINSCTVGGAPVAGNIFECPHLLERFKTFDSTPTGGCWEVCRLCICEYEAPNC